ncbi:MAG: hypothetical protein FWF95_04935, partial [Syntrophorhabdaceae bacterium]|nr:hypothetical protein [Syntrophorhabdaceae bacterium]
MFAALAFVLLFVMFASCNIFSEKKPDKKTAQYISYRDIPGVTDDEIRAIEKFKEKGSFFVFGMLPSTEMFSDIQSGELNGYSVLFCQWLTKLFGIEFKPELYEWGDLLTGMELGTVSFSGELTPNDERRKKYFMTGTIAARPVKAFRLRGSEPFSDIAKSRPVLYMFLGGSTATTDVTSL